MTEKIDSGAVAGRQCRGCTLCCKLMGIVEIDKPAGVWCPHCLADSGCGIYERRPGECRRYNCLYLTDAGIPEAWYPARSKMVLAVELGGDRLTAYVDGGRSDAWKAEPYHSQLRAWARRAVTRNRQILVRIGKKVIVILPDRDVDLGVVGDDELVVTQYNPTSFGVTAEAFKVKKDDLRVGSEKKK